MCQLLLLISYIFKIEEISREKKERKQKKYCTEKNKQSKRIFFSSSKNQQILLENVRLRLLLMVVLHMFHNFLYQFLV